MADGGEGTVAAFLEAGATRISRTVGGPLGDPVEAEFALAGETAIVESAAASGLQLLAGRAPDALRASSAGTGELVRAALEAGARRIVVGLGGSATTDGGAGLLQALGARLLDAHERPLQPGGAALAELARLDLSGIDPRLREVRLEVAADVDNPLTGPRGASAVFGPQKGADAAGVDLLEAGLSRYAAVAAQTLGTDRSARAGMGAAGGLGFALCAVLGASMRPGVEIVADLRGLGEALADARWCFTGEGSIDDQTLSGKTVAGVARLAAAHGARTLAFGGRVTPEAERELAARGIVVFPIADGPMDLAAALAGASGLLQRAAARAARLLE
jgi:glycerate kinase